MYQVSFPCAKWGITEVTLHPGVRCLTSEQTIAFLHVFKIHLLCFVVLAYNLFEETKNFNILTNMKVNFHYRMTFLNTKLTDQVNKSALYYHLKF